MRYFLVPLLVLLIASSSLAEEVYRWVDDKGRVHFSDQPKSKSKNNKDSTHDWVDVRGRKTYSDRSEDQIKAERRRLSRNMECMSGLTEIIEIPSSQPRSRVVLLTARWCGLSRQARQHLKKKKIRFVEYDIERNRLGRSLYLSLARKGVPVILIGKKQMFGFRADLADTLLQEHGQIAGRRK